jgi:hypothetical protein
VLELRPTCENCNAPLPPEAANAMICSFECTFCETCVEAVLHNVCPNCGGGFERRPVRPRQNLRNDNDTAHFPPSPKVKHRPVDPAAHAVFAASLRFVRPDQR